MTEAIEPRVIHSDIEQYVLAATEEDARDHAESEGYEIVEESGWVMETGWDQDTYESRAEFERESGHTSWWMGCQPPPDSKPTPSCMRAWVVRAT